MKVQGEWVGALTAQNAISIVSCWAFNILHRHSLSQTDCHTYLSLQKAHGKGVGGAPVYVSV